MSRTVDFRRVAAAALANVDVVLLRWLPRGRREGAEWVATNPARADNRPGSFKVNLRTGAQAGWSPPFVDLKNTEGRKTLPSAVSNRCT
jgi:hypothetical protein